MKKEKPLNIAKAFYKTRNIIKIKIPFLSVFSRILEEHNIIKDDKHQTHATDGTRYYYNEAFSQKLSPSEFTFINMHEIYHVLFQHNLRMRNKDRQIYNLAADIKINRSSPNKVEQAITNPFKKMRGSPVNHRN